MCIWELTGLRRCGPGPLVSPGVTGNHGQMCVCLYVCVSVWVCASVQCVCMCIRIGYKPFVWFGSEDGVGVIPVTGNRGLEGCLSCTEPGQVTRSGYRTCLPLSSGRKVS